ncbi:FAD-binding protein [Streptomyces sp. INA 01156]
MTSTYCGVAVDAVGRVLTESGAAVPGLYAAGEVVGGFHGKAYVTGTALSKGLIFGRLAASHIALEAAAR